MFRVRNRSIPYGQWQKRSAVRQCMGPVCRSGLGVPYQAGLAGRISIITAGPGSARILGVGRRIITAAGFAAASAGRGGRVRLVVLIIGARHWSASSAGGGGFGIGFGFGNVGWVPLAPFEVFHPWYGRGFIGGEPVQHRQRQRGRSSFRNARFTNAVTSVRSAGLRTRVNSSGKYGPRFLGWIWPGRRRDQWRNAVLAHSGKRTIFRRRG